MIARHDQPERARHHVDPVALARRQLLQQSPDFTGLRVIGSRYGEPLSGAVRANVNPSAILYTDDWRPYRPLGPEYRDHRVINHSDGSYVVGDVYTNTIEGFFGNLKTGMRGAYKKVSKKWLQSYLDEYAWRYNARREPQAMFEQLLQRAASA